MTDNIINYRLDPVYARQAFDWYTEPDWVVERLLDSVAFDGPIHDPACGGGNIPKTAMRRGHIATGSDLVDRGFGGGGVDFLDDPTRRVNIICNPPYVLGERFALHGLKIAERRVAMLVRLAFLEGQGRRKRLYLPHPPEKVLVCATRPSMPPGDLAIKATGGKTAFAWIIWSNTPPPGCKEGEEYDPPESTISWLP